MRRVYADATGFRVSLPGYDAETDADPRHFIFDSRNRAYFGIFMSGVIPASTWQAPCPGSSTYDIMFGKTFATPPPALVMWGGGVLYSGVSASFYSIVSGAYVYAGYLSMVDRLRLYGFGAFTSSVPPSESAAYYIVGQS